MKQHHILPWALLTLVRGTNEKFSNDDKVYFSNKFSGFCFLSSKKADWYTAKCELLCDEEKGRFLDSKKLLKYKDWYPYDTTQQVNGDSIAMSFDFIADCCLEFKGSVNVDRDTLNLLYGLANDTIGGCDCSCDYRMVYKIKNDNLHWSILKITNTDGNKPY